MSLPEMEVMIGQMIVMDLRGTTVSEDIAKMLEAGPLGGFLLFPGNDAAPEQVRRLTDSLRELSSSYPPMIAIDQEGGRVLRLKKPFTQIPAMRRLGAKNDEGLALEIGKVFGSELRAVGINTDFAPVVDLDLNPDNQVIGDRALHSDPQVVSRLACAIIRGLQSEKIVTCAKHFPGHGASREDSHLELPTVSEDAQLVRGRELGPFKDAIACGAETVMIGHIRYPAFDKYHPASLSEPVITGLLRKEMGFDGVIVVDSLEMKALAGIPVGDRAFMAARAGADIMLIAEGLESAKTIHMMLCQAVTMGLLPVEKITDAFSRIMKLKEKFLKPSDLPPVAEVSRIVGSAEHQKIAASF